MTQKQKASASKRLSEQRNADLIKKVDAMQKALERIAMRGLANHPVTNEPDYQGGFEMCQLIAYETVKAFNPKFLGKSLFRI